MRIDHVPRDMDNTNGKASNRPVSRNRSKLSRASGHRSRGGCLTCKQRHVCGILMECLVVTHRSQGQMRRGEASMFEMLSKRLALQGVFSVPEVVI